MNVSTAIRTAFVAALTGNVLHNAVTVPILDAFDIQDDEMGYPYILIGSQEESQRTGKNRRPYDCTINIDVVTGDLKPIGRELSENITDQIDEIVNPESRVMLDSSAYGWIIGDIIEQNSSNINARKKVFYIFRKITTYGIITTRV